MQITIVYEDNVINSKSVEIADDEVAQYAEGIYQSVENLDKLKIETEDGWVILPQDVLKKSIIFVNK